MRTTSSMHQVISKRQRRVFTPLIVVSLLVLGLPLSGCYAGTTYARTNTPDVYTGNATHVYVVADRVEGDPNAVYEPQSTVVVVTPPPAPRYVVRRPPLPFAGALWVRGYWNWTSGRYVWRTGHYIRPRAGYVFVAPRWERRSGRYVFVRGFFRPRHAVVRSRTVHYHGTTRRAPGHAHTVRSVDHGHQNIQRRHTRVVQPDGDVVHRDVRRATTDTRHGEREVVRRRRTVVDDDGSRTTQTRRHGTADTANGQRRAQSQRRTTVSPNGSRTTTSRSRSTPQRSRSSSSRSSSSSRRTTSTARSR